MNLIDFFDNGAAIYPKKSCLIQGKQSWSFAEIETLTHQVALSLQVSGVKPGDRVAVYSPNHAMAFVAMFGIYRVGAVWVPINARNVFEENIHILRNSGVSFLFTHSKFTDILELFNQQLPDLKPAVIIDNNEGQNGLHNWLDKNSKINQIFPPRPDSPNAMVALPSTGGTTGKPKSIICTNRTMETLVASYMACMPVYEPPIHLVVAPMTHAAGATMFPLLPLGATTVIMEEMDVEGIMQMIESHKVTHLFLPPTVIYVMLAHPNVRNYDYSSLKYFLYAAAPMSSDKLKEAIDVFGPVMAQTFGQSEAPMICTYLSPKDHIDAITSGNEHRLKSCGRIAPFTRLEIMDEVGNLLSRGSHGEIVVRGGLVMSGYYNNPEETKTVSAFDWHHTGDIGYIDDEGFVYIVDRKKDMIITGGFNVFPVEVEQVIWSHPAVQDCAVIGVPDDKWGEAIKAVIEPVPGQTIDPNEIINLCKTKLGSVKAPKTVDICEALPRSPVGKVLKKEIRKPFWSDKSRIIQ